MIGEIGRGAPGAEPPASIDGLTSPNEALFCLYDIGTAMTIL